MINVKRDRYIHDEGAGYDCRICDNSKGEYIMVDHPDYILCGDCFSNSSRSKDDVIEIVDILWHRVELLAACKLARDVVGEIPANLILGYSDPAYKALVAIDEAIAKAGDQT